jgi:hypothetical protein
MRRFYAVLLTCAMLLFGAVSPARADANYDYLDKSGDPQSHAIPDGHGIGGDWDTSSTTLTGWYAVTGTVTVNHTLTVSGEAHLILTDGASLAVNGDGNDAGVNVALGNSLTVYAQSAGPDMGSLTANGTLWGAGIGGGLDQSCGAVVINGGRVTASSVGSGNSGGAGIGGGMGSANNAGGSGGTITINGGAVTASGSLGAGIGGGEGNLGGGGGTITINGGAVTASGAYGAGIGGGAGNGIGADLGGGIGGTITIAGGAVNASGYFGAGIGGGGGVGLGSGGGGGAITIGGGTVTASSVFNVGVGIGGGRADMSSINGDGGTVVISGGSVKGSIQATPTNGGANGSHPVFLAQTKLDGVSAVTKVTGFTVSSAPYYGTKDLYTDAAGTLYPYLPSGAAAMRAETKEHAYEGSVSQQGNGTLSELGSDSALSGLAMSEGTLNPAFSANTTAYTASVPYGVEGVTVTATAHDATGATLKVNTVAATSGVATGEIPLDVGGNTIEVVCKAEDGINETAYTVTVTRQPEPLSTDSALSGLALSHGALDPAFSANTTAYAASVPYGVEGVTVTATAHDATGATLKVNTVAATSGVATGEIPLTVGGNTIEVVCTAEDGVNHTTYTVTVTRSGAPVISLQPSDRTVTEGQRATFTVEAVGPGTLSYQWYVDRDGAKGWAAIDSAGARAATYTTPKAKLKSSGTRYACMVTNDAGSVRSDPATLTVIEKSTPQTGDGSNLKLWLTLLLLSGAALALLAGQRAFRRR